VATGFLRQMCRHAGDIGAGADGVLAGFRRCQDGGDHWSSPPVTLMMAVSLGYTCVRADSVGPVEQRDGLLGLCGLGSLGIGGEIRLELVKAHAVNGLGILLETRMSWERWQTGGRPSSSPPGRSATCDSPPASFGITRAGPCTAWRMPPCPRRPPPARYSRRRCS